MNGVVEGSQSRVCMCVTCVRCVCVCVKLIAVRAHSAQLTLASGVKSRLLASLAGYN